MGNFYYLQNISALSSVGRVQLNPCLIISSEERGRGCHQNFERYLQSALHIFMHIIRRIFHTYIQNVEYTYIHIYICVCINVCIMCIEMYMKLFVQGTDMKLECFMYNIYKSIISILLP